MRYKVAIISNNRPEWAVSYYAVNGRGAVLVPLYEAQTEKDWRFIIHNCEAKVLIVATEEIYAKTMPYFGESFPKLETIICLKDYPSLINAVLVSFIALPVRKEEPAPEKLVASRIFLLTHQMELVTCMRFP